MIKLSYRPTNHELYLSISFQTFTPFFTKILFYFVCYSAALVWHGSFSQLFVVPFLTLSVYVLSVVRAFCFTLYTYFLRTRGTLPEVLFPLCFPLQQTTSNGIGYRMKYCIFYGFATNTVHVRNHNNHDNIFTLPWSVLSLHIDDASRHHTRHDLASRYPLHWHLHDLAVYLTRCTFSLLVIAMQVRQFVLLVFLLRIHLLRLHLKNSRDFAFDTMC